MSETMTDAPLISSGPDVIERPLNVAQRELLDSGLAVMGDKALDVPVSTLTDRQLAEEAVLLQRRQRDAVNSLLAGIESSPLGKMLKGGGNPLAMLAGFGK